MVMPLHPNSRILTWLLDNRISTTLISPVTMAREGKDPHVGWRGSKLKHVKRITNCSWSSTRWMYHSPTCGTARVYDRVIHYRTKPMTKRACIPIHAMTWTQKPWSVRTHMKRGQLMVDHRARTHQHRSGRHKTVQFACI